MSVSTLEDLVSLATKQLSIETTIGELEEQLKEAKEEYRNYSQEIIPAVMEELGIETFTLSNGYKINIKEDVFAKIPESYVDQAFQWLEETNNDGIIKTQVITNFGKGESENALKAVELLSENGMFATLKKNVHPQTLKAFVREQISKGSGIPLDVFGASVVKTTIIQLPK